MTGSHPAALTRVSQTLLADPREANAGAEKAWLLP